MSDKQTCGHKNTGMAGYPVIVDGECVDLIYMSAYHVYCEDCGHYFTMITSPLTCIDDKGLAHFELSDGGERRIVAAQGEPSKPPENALLPCGCCNELKPIPLVVLNAANGEE